MFTKYDKLIVGGVGILATLLGPDFLGLTENTAALTENILGLLTLLGIYGVPNKT